MTDSATDTYFPLPAPEAESLSSSAFPIMIYTLGRFEVHLNNIPLVFSGKVQKKPLELLKALIAHGARRVSVATLAGELWSDGDGAEVLNSFNVALHRLRQLLGSNRAIRKQEDEISFDRDLVWVDAWAFEELLLEARKPMKDGAAGEERALERIRAAVALYKGPFLPCVPDKPWAYTYREHLRGRFTHAAGHVCRHLESQGDTHQAIVCYRDGLEIDHLSEEFYQQLMLCYLKAGLHAEAAVVWECCRRNLAIHLAIEPSPRTLEIYRKITG